MKNHSELLLMAEAYVNSISTEEYDFKIFKVIDFKEGLIVSFQTKEFVEDELSDNPVIGLLPFIIDKSDGYISHKKSLLDTQERIKEFRRERGF